MQRPEAITDLKQLSDCLTLTACIPDLSLDDRTLALPRGASRIFSETAAEWEGVEMWPLHADPSERNIREGLFSLGVMRHVGGECVVCLAGALSFSVSFFVFCRTANLVSGHRSPTSIPSRPHNYVQLIQYLIILL